MSGHLIAIDWGTTNRRAYLLDEAGEVLDRVDGGAGVLSMAPDGYPAAIAELRARLGDHPVLAAGMVGSTRGWREAPYAPAPAGLDEVAGALVEVADRVRIVPGVAIDRDGRSDVMRGEEVQLLGAAAVGLVPADAVLVQPGTHSKWATMQDGRIRDFRTHMTGELFALLRDHSVLADMLRGIVQPGPAFFAGVDRGGRDLLAELFAIRAGVLRGTLPAEHAAARASGLLIGAEIAAADEKPDILHLLSEGPLARLYDAALAARGVEVRHVDSHAAFVAGIHHIRERAFS